MTSGSDLLEASLELAEPLVEVGTPIPCAGTENYDLAVVATALLRKAYIQAAAVASLAKGPVPDAAVPNLRSLLEAFGELTFLLEGGDSLSKARIAFLYALREIRDFLAKWDGDADDLRRVESELATKGAQIPAEHRAALAARNYWPTIGRAELTNQALDRALREAGTTPESGLGKQLYKLLSWDEHHVMATLLTIELNPASPTFGRVKAQETWEDPHDFLAMLAAGTLDAMRRHYATVFPPVEPGTTPTAA